MFRLHRIALWVILAPVSFVVVAKGADPLPPIGPAGQTALAEIDQRTEELKQVNRSIWEFAEVGLEERKSSALLVEKLKAAGFEVRTGVSGMPTAFVATFGSGRPIIGILAEYDALPGMSQKVSADREPVTEGAPGHACGHSGLGTGALGAALAVKVAIEKHRLPGTIRLYGTPAEETMIGKVYMLLDKQFDDLDICLHWHPAARNGAWGGSSKAALSVKFTFSGIAAHAAASPDSGRSALDGVELMNVGTNYMREHVKEDARIHYVVTDGGGAPNVVPASATVWYYIRADKHTDVEEYYTWIKDIARGAALMSRTKVGVQVDTDCHEVIANAPLSELIHRNLRRIGPPKFSPEEHTFARRMQRSLAEEFKTEFKFALAEDVETLPSYSEPSRGSTDVGDISWYVPTGGLRTTCAAEGSPGHSWQNVAGIGSTIGEKGIIYAAKTLAVTAIDLLEQPELIQSAKAAWKKRMEGKKYVSLIPAGQKAPVKIR